MKLYREKPKIVEAKQWHKAGDHHRVEMMPVPFDQKLLVKLCRFCGRCITDHGTIGSLEDWSQTVCPGDYLVKTGRDEYQVVKRKEFEERFEEVV